MGNGSINEGYIDEGLATLSASYYYLLRRRKQFNQDMKKRSDSLKLKLQSSIIAPNEQGFERLRPNEYSLRHVLRTFKNIRYDTKRSLKKD